jgi:hypothetical protein
VSDQRPDPPEDPPGPPWTVTAYTRVEPGPIEVRIVLEECDDDDDLGRWWPPSGASKSSAIPRDHMPPAAHTHSGASARPGVRGGR